MVHTCTIFVKQMSSAPSHTAQQIPSVGLLDQEVARDRLLLAMAESIVDRGLDQTTVADIVRIARVSRRTFYEEFSDRSDCFLELCDRSTLTARDLIERAADPALPWREQAVHAIDAYFAFMSAEPALTRSFLFEIFGMGEAGGRKFREIQHRFSEQLLAIARRIRADEPEINELSYAMTSAVVSGICELVMLSLEDDQRVSTEEARDAALQLVFDVLTAPR